MSKYLLVAVLTLGAVCSRPANAAMTVVVSVQPSPPIASLNIQGATVSAQYKVQRSTNFASWSDLDTVTAPSANFVYQDNTINGMTRAFYRLIMVAFEPVVPHTNWTLLHVDSEETVAENGTATRAFDGDPATYWVTHWQDVAAPLPHEIQIDLGAVYTLGALKYLPRQDGMFVGDIGRYEIYVSLDGANWGDPVATGAFALTADEQLIGFTPKDGRYVRFRALTEVTGAALTAIAELNLLQVNPALNQAPTAVIDLPAGDLTIAVGASVNFAAHGDDADGNLPLHYRWSFAAGSGIADSLFQAPGQIAFTNPGTFSVALTVTDSLGLSTMTTRTITVQSAVATVIPHTGWRVSYVDSQELAGENGNAANVFDGDSDSIWVTQWRDAAPRGPHEIQIDVGVARNLCGFRYMPRQGLENGRIADYEFYISDDGVTWGNPVAIGRFANSNQEKEVFFPALSGRYIRFRALTEVHDHPWTVIAELNLLQSGNMPNQAPTAGIGSPSGPVTIVAGCAIDFSGTANDGDANVPLHYRWSFGSLSGIEDSSVENPGLVRFNVPGTYQVAFNVADDLGLSGEQVVRTVTVLGGGSAIPRNDWSVLYKDSEETVGENGAATNVLDGDPLSHWVTHWFGTATTMPHELQIDLGANYSIGGFRYLPRQDGINLGDIGIYDFYVSTDGVNWEAAVATGRFPLSQQEQEVGFPAKRGRYIRFRALAEFNGNPWTAVSEVNVLQAQEVTPSVRLLRPQSKFLQTSPDLNVIAAASLTAGQGVRFMLDGGVANGGVEADQYTAPYQALFSAVNAGPHVVDAYVIDAGGAVVSGPGTHDQAGQVGIGETFVAMGDSVTLGFDDDMSSDDVSQDGRTIGGGYEPVLANSLASELGHTVVIANEGIFGDRSAEGAVLCPGVLAKHSSATHFLILYGSSDYSPSGLGLQPGDAGYAGSFKDNMQRMINDVNSAGKIPVLGKIPARLPLDGGDNARLQEYNAVIDELIANPVNQITTPAPDFYTYFHDHTDQLADGFHPNGLGYQAMAGLWFDALTP
jgi:lysophospholipase L1-like esterase/PKD repeat protein